MTIMTRKSLKIGRYTEEEIFQYMTDVEGSMLGRSMYDAIFNTIHALITERDQLKKDKKTLQKTLQNSEKNAENLQRELDIKNEALKLIKDIAYDYDGFNDIDSLKGLIDDLRAIAIRGLKGQIILERTDK